MEFNDLGICMAGNGPAIDRTVSEICDTFSDNITYVEIGVGSGGTLLHVARELSKRVKDWRAIGIDLPDGYSLCVHSILENLRPMRMRIIKDEVKDVHHPQHWEALANGVTLVLAPSQAALRVFWPDLPIHLGLIDGCHGVACVKGDFYAMSPKIPPNGIIMFHDFGEDSVGEPQPHCGIGDTQEACKQLGLLPNQYGVDGQTYMTYKALNWELVEHVVADKSKNGRDLGIFRKVEWEKW